MSSIITLNVPKLFDGHCTSMNRSNRKIVFLQKRKIKDKGCTVDRIETIVK